MRLITTIALLCIALSGCGKSKPQTLIEDGYDKQEMNDAITRAQREVDSFIKELAKPTGKNHAVKVPIVDKNGTEHFWLTNVSFQNGSFKGKIGNEPGIVGNVKIGQEWSVKKNEISDWMYMRDGKIYGNYTMRPLIKTMPAEEAAKWRSMIANP
jgi:uncharacterized protein YegJ (DUF2314 family)